MKKVFFLAILLSVLTLQVAFSQNVHDRKEHYIGVRAGLNFPWTGFKVRPVIGVFGEFGITNYFSLSVEADYVMDAHRLKENDLQHTKPIETKGINLPVLANFELMPGWDIKAGVQPSVFFWNYEDYYGNNPQDGSTFMLTVPLGMSYCFNFGLFLDARLNLLNTCFGDRFGLQPVTGQFSIGYKLPLNR